MSNASTFFNESGAVYLRSFAEVCNRLFTVEETISEKSKLLRSLMQNKKRATF